MLGFSVQYVPFNQGVVDHIRTSALTTADRRLPSWN